jgi:hypothetical protein
VQLSQTNSALVEVQRALAGTQKELERCKEEGGGMRDEVRVLCFLVLSM